MTGRAWTRRREDWGEYEETREDATRASSYRPRLRWISLPCLATPQCGQARLSARCMGTP